MGVFDYLRWNYDRAFEQLFGQGGGNWETNSNVHVVAQGMGVEA